MLCVCVYILVSNDMITVWCRTPVSYIRCNGSQGIVSEFASWCSVLLLVVKLSAEQRSTWGFGEFVSYFFYCTWEFKSFSSEVFSVWRYGFPPSLLCIYHFYFKMYFRSPPWIFKESTSVSTDATNYPAESFPASSFATADRSREPSVAAGDDPC